MPTSPLENLETAAVEPSTPELRTGEAAGRDPKSDTDQDATLYPEAVANLLTPNRRRTNVSSASFAAIRRAVGKP